ncbi:Uncharacterised protein [BD1-7 clade bacterium]|uniref:Major facilitator superfamily (MFS) profile domain-containing protein n=1 Tax=BD1-7 clade bacterium TaxID=2029982 RepID=A0A5S9NSR8_9GAMM|nr:Uncharacterised protein [BD1-7 clade bacterium]CAA0093650.1 Uncharacterised protein [BD1-7 clade bacterium]
MKTHRNVAFVFLNVGHFFDHFFLLIYATAAAVSLTSVWHVSYAELVRYATPAFVAFGIGSIPAGWLADRWSREGMMSVFYIGMGLSAIAAGFCDNPVTLAIALTFIGVFAAIYHPVGLAMVVQGRHKTGTALAINGVFGNLGVACAGLFTGFLISWINWRAAFIVPGILATMVGVGYVIFVIQTSVEDHYHPEKPEHITTISSINRDVLVKTFVIVLITTAIGGFIFQSTTFTLPKLISDRLIHGDASASLIGSMTFIVFALAAAAQLLVGYLVDRYSTRLIFGSVALIQVVLFLIMTRATGITGFIVTIGFMLAVFGQIPINDVLVGKIAHSQWRSRAYAIRAFVTFGVQAVTLPGIAWIYANFGFPLLFIALAIAALCIFGVTTALPDHDVI